MLNFKKAFSLLELAMTVFVIGLLLVAVATGKNLLHTSKLNALLTEIKSIDNAIINFKQTYEAYPGDFTKASKFWGGSLDGDGDGKIDHLANSAGTSSEVVMAGHHLKSAGLIESAIPSTEENTDTYKSYIKSQHFSAHAGFLVTSFTRINQTTTNRNDISSNKNITLRFGAGFNSSNSHVLTAIFSTDDAYKMDYKIDDGLPFTGKFGAGNDNANATDNTGYCVNVTASPATYDFTDTESIQCSISYDISQQL